MAGCNITPDENLLSQLFSERRPKMTVFLQDWEKCVFKAEFPQHANNCPSARVVRLEVNNDNSKAFATVAAMQQIAANIIPDLVPKTHQVGTVKDSQGRLFHFSVTDFVEGDTLQDVWEQISAEEQSSIVVELVEALDKLHSVRPSNIRLKVLSGAPYKAGDEFLKTLEQPGIFGGPHTGFLNTGSALLSSIMERRKLDKLFCVMESSEDPVGVRLQSNFKSLGSMAISDLDMQSWPGEAVFCHNDLTPRNLILQRRVSQDGALKYQLAGIVDWELAGFYPASYELSLQDTYLSSANRHVSFYLKLKQHMRHSVPRTLSQVKLLEAMELIFESQQRMLTDGTNIPAHIRKRFIENLRLVRDSDPYVGWISRPQDRHLAYDSNAAGQKLEDDVVQEMMARRRKAKGI